MRVEYWQPTALRAMSASDASARPSTRHCALALCLCLVESLRVARSDCLRVNGESENTTYLRCLCEGRTTTGPKTRFAHKSVLLRAKDVTKSALKRIGTTEVLSDMSSFAVLARRVPLMYAGAPTRRSSMNDTFSRRSTLHIFQWKRHFCFTS